MARLRRQHGLLRDHPLAPHLRPVHPPSPHPRQARPLSEVRLRPARPAPGRRRGGGGLPGMRMESPTGTRGGRERRVKPRPLAAGWAADANRSCNQQLVGPITGRGFPWAIRWSEASRRVLASGSRSTVPCAMRAMKVIALPGRAASGTPRLAGPHTRPCELITHCRVPCTASEASRACLSRSHDRLPSVAGRGTPLTAHRSPHDLPLRCRSWHRLPTRPPVAAVHGRFFSSSAAASPAGLRYMLDVGPDGAGRPAATDRRPAAS